MRATSRVMAGVVTLAMTGAIVAGAAGVASAAAGTYDPANPPYPSDANSVTTVRIYDAATGAEVKSGSTDTPLSNYVFAAATDFGTADAGSGRKAQLSGFLAETGKVPTAFSGQLLGSATTFPVTAGSTTFSNPSAKGGSTNTFGGLATSYPNTAPSTDNFYQLYQVRVRTTFPTPTSTSYAIADIQIDPTTGIWHEVKPATAPYNDPPNRPVAPNAASGLNAKTTLTFAAPSAPAGAPVLDYSVVVTPTSPAGPALAPVVVSSSPATISGLTNGTTYSATITARNANGSGARSASSNPFTPAPPGPPTAPTAVSATAGNGNASVSFTPPVVDPASPITSYTITTNPGAITTSGTSSPITVPGLSNGTQYSFTVTATNANGTSPASSPAATATPVAPTSTAVSLSGGPYDTTTLITVSATVTSPGNTVSTGSVAFTDNLDGALGTGTVDASGVATIPARTFSGTGSTQHIVTATFTDGPAFTGSTGQSQPFTVAYAAGNPCASPNGQCTETQYFKATVAAGSLVISTPYTQSNPFDLGTLALNSSASLLTASAPFGTATIPAAALQADTTKAVSSYANNYSGVTIADGRAGNNGWTASLNGSDFTSGTGPATKTIDGRNLGFTGVTPAYIPGNALQNVTTAQNPAANGVAPGGAIASGQPVGIKGAKVFAAAPAGASVGSVYVYGTMTLQAPTSTPAGIYNATVTFTIV